MSYSDNKPPPIPKTQIITVDQANSSARPSSTLAIVSLVLSLVSVPIGLLGFLSIFPASFLGGVCGLPFCFAPFMSMPLALAAAITGFIALKKVQNGTATGRGLALGGMITGIVVIVLNIVLAVGYIFLFGLGVAAYENPNY